MNALKINAQITLLFDRGGLNLRLRDYDSKIVFLDLQLTQEQTCEALARLSETPVAECEVRGLDKLGKKMEHRTIEFKMPKKKPYDKDAAAAEAAKHTPEGWESDNYFGSQGSFFMIDREPWARCTIRRWL